MYSFGFISSLKNFVIACSVCICVTAANAHAIDITNNITTAVSFHHHVHNFFFNDSDDTKDNYLVMQQHALAMSYDATTHYLLKELPSKYDKLNRIMLHDAYFIPLKVDFSTVPYEVKYSASYRDKENRSQVNLNRIVWESYPIDANDMEIIKNYACAKSPNYNALTINSSFNDFSRHLYIDSDYKTIIANWQSKFIVKVLAEATLENLKTKNYDYLFIDDITRNITANPNDGVVAECVNKTFGGEGYYNTWKAGQLAFLQKISEGAHQLKGYHDSQIKVFGNIWSPFAGNLSETAAKWYENNDLRLDHYYFESGGFASEDVYGQVANDTIPEGEVGGGLPAFKPLGGGYIPASLVSLGTHIDTMYMLANDPENNTLFNDYLLQHYIASGTAAVQGSWFGWYGETSVDKKNVNNKLIHTNEMQLLRAIPNWDNLSEIPLNQRSYDIEKNQYISPNSQFNSEVIISKNPVNGDIYVLVKKLGATLNLSHKSIKQAYFVNDFFMKKNYAKSCFEAIGEKTKFICANRLGQGIRIPTSDESWLTSVVNLNLF
jgi:hypothetical protein